MHKTFFKSDIRPAALERADRRKALTAKDEKESRKVKARSGGRCEVVTIDDDWRGKLIEFLRTGEPSNGRCQRRAFHVHHRLSGIGVRGRKASALASNKLHLCDRCHSEIHAHILVPDGNQFRRVT